MFQNFSLFICSVLEISSNISSSSLIIFLVLPCMLMSSPRHLFLFVFCFLSLLSCWILSFHICVYIIQPFFHVHFFSHLDFGIRVTGHFLPGIFVYRKFSCAFFPLSHTCPFISNVTMLKVTCFHCLTPSSSIAAKFYQFSLQLFTPLPYRGHFSRCSASLFLLLQMILSIISDSSFPPFSPIFR